MTINESSVPLCGSVLNVWSRPGGVALPPKVCCLPKGHPGNHSDASAQWYNSDAKREQK